MLTPTPIRQHRSDHDIGFPQDLFSDWNIEQNKCENSPGRADLGAGFIKVWISVAILFVTLRLGALSRQMLLLGQHPEQSQSLSFR